MAGIARASPTPNRAAVTRSVLKSRPLSASAESRPAWAPENMKSGITASSMTTAIVQNARTGRRVTQRRNLPAGVQLSGALTDAEVSMCLRLHASRRDTVGIVSRFGEDAAHRLVHLFAA